MQKDISFQAERGHWFHGYINEIVVDAPTLKVVRYWTHPMKGNDGVLMLNPLVQLKQAKGGNWRAYFLDQAFEEWDFPIFQTKGVPCLF